MRAQLSSLSLGDSRKEIQKSSNSSSSFSSGSSTLLSPSSLSPFPKLLVPATPSPLLSSSPASSPAASSLPSSPFSALSPPSRASSTPPLRTPSLGTIASPYLRSDIQVPDIPSLYQLLVDATEQWGAPIVIVDIIFQYTRQECILVLGGIDLTGNSLHTSEKFNSHYNTWERLPNLLSSRRGACAVCLDDKIYIIGGHFAGYCLKTCEMLDLETKKWTTLMSLKEARFNAGAFAWNNNIYIFGGDNGSENALSSGEVYNPKIGRWSILPSTMPSGKHQFGTVDVDDKLFVIGGGSSINASTGVNTVEYYNPSSDSWISVTNMNQARIAMATCAVDHQIFACGGLDETGKMTDSVEVYDRRTNLWTELEPMPDRRVYARAFAITGWVHVVGGQGWGHRTPDTLLYDPWKKEWTKGKSLLTPRTLFAGCTIES